MEIRDVALVHALPISTSSPGPWDWETRYVTPDFGIATAFAALASWLASMVTRSTVPALRAIPA